MENSLVFGIITFLSSAACFILAFRKYSVSPKYALVFIIIGGLLLRIFCACDLYLHESDESFHALVAKNMLAHPFRPTLYETPLLDYNFKQWYANHIWVHKQPIPLWSMSAAMFLFGIHEFVLRLPSLLLGTFAIYLTFQIALYFFDTKTALLAAFLHAINGLIIEIGAGRVATDHIDIFFLFFIELAIYFVVRYQNKSGWTNAGLIGLFTGMAILCKWLPALIVYAIWFCIELYNKRIIKVLPYIIFSLVISAVTFLPWQFYIYKVFPQEAAWETYYNNEHIFSTLGNQAGGVFYHVDKARIIWNELIYFYLFWFIWMSIVQRKIRKHSALLVWILIPYIFFSIVTTKMQGYLLFTGPAIFMILAHSMFQVRTMILNTGRIRIANILFGLTLALSVRYSIERVKPFKNQPFEPVWATEVKQLQTLTNNSNAVIFNVERYVDVMFYNDNIVAYNKLPGKNQIDSLQNVGWDVYVIKDERIPKDFNLPVKFLELKNINK